MAAAASARPRPEVPAERASRERHAPWFTSLWLGLTSLLYVALADVNGLVRGPIVESLYFTPAEALAAPWRVLLTPLGVAVSHDAIQFSYVVGLFALAVPAFETSQGWRRTAFVFLAGGIGSVLLASALVLAPLAFLFPENPVVLLSWTRFYSGGSTGVFAVIGALAALQSGWWRWGLLGAGAAWELGIAAYYYRFGELIPIFHWGALLLGFALVRTRAFERLR